MPNNILLNDIYNGNDIAVGTKYQNKNEQSLV